MKQLKNIQVENNQSIATIWLNRPKVHNALNGEMLKELINCFELLNRSEQIRIIVLRGIGASFCSGADIEWLYQPANSNYTTNTHKSQLLATCFQTIFKSIKPVIALVHGNVLAGGIGLMCACDIAIALEHTLFSIPETRRGLVPSTILPYVLTRLNQHKAKVLIYTGQKVNSFNALELGLIDFLFSENESELKIMSLLNDLLKASPNALSKIKTLLSYCTDKPLNPKMIKTTTEILDLVKNSKEGKEGMAAFIEKRSPAWVQQINDFKLYQS